MMKAVADNYQGYQKYQKFLLIGGGCVFIFL